MIILLLILYDPTTLVYPPYSHTLGYHRGTISHLRLAAGKSIDEIEIGSISASKIKLLDDPSTVNDDDELTIFLSDLLSSNIYFNKGLTDFGVYESPVIGDSALWIPSDVENNGSDTVWIVDRKRNRVVRFRFDGKSLRFIDTFGKFGILPGCFDDPRQISVTENGIYITDSGNDRVQLFNRDGDFIKEYGGFNRPVGISAISSHDDWLRYRKNFIYVVDSLKSRITKLDREGVIKARIRTGKMEFSKVQFEHLAIDYYGYLWVTDSYNNCIHLFDHNLEYVVKFGRKGTGHKEFLYPVGITIWRRYGQVFVSDTRSIQYFWIGVDAWIKGVEPGVFEPGQGVTVAFYNTQPADLIVEIYDSNDEPVRRLDFGRIHRLGKNYIFWDSEDEKGKSVGEGIYRIDLIFKPTYSSKGKFEKKISTEVECRI